MRFPVPFFAGFRAMLAVFVLCQPVPAQELSALARLDPGASGLIANDEGGLELTFDLSQPVPWRLRFLDKPPRLVLDAREIDWTGVQLLAVPNPALTLRAGSFRPGWSRLVIELAGPQAVTSAEMTTDGGRATIRIALTPSDAQSFADEANKPDL
ncbi:MAG: AMIN domain-containing protein, partial [Tabrizicola sp.]|nr:AMIN domain-containing protein [Tabrizicola sp.]